MPCYDGREDGRQSIVDDVRAATRRENETEIRILRERNDRLTRLLCGLLTSMEKNPNRGTAFYLTQVFGLGKWWKEHQEFDRKRKLKGK